MSEHQLSSQICCLQTIQIRPQGRCAMRTRIWPDCQRSACYKLLLQRGKPEGTSRSQGNGHTGSICRVEMYFWISICWLAICFSAWVCFASIGLLYQGCALICCRLIRSFSSMTKMRFSRSMHSGDRCACTTMLQCKNICATQKTRQYSALMHSDNKCTSPQCCWYKSVRGLRDATNNRKPPTTFPHPH